MTQEEQFLKDLEDWLKMQVMINQVAVAESEKEAQENQDERAKDAAIRYESRLDAYQYLLGKFDNYHTGKSFHDLPEDLLGSRQY